MILSICLLILGFVLLIKGADFFIDGASSIAQNLNISKIIIGLTIVAFGTSLPEFAVSLQALAKGSGDIVLGNVIGSNITNSLLILGIGTLIYPILVKKNTVQKEMPICVLISTLFVVLFLDHQISGDSVNIFSRGDALAVLLFFAIFVYYIFTITRKKEEKEKEKPKYKILPSILFAVGGLIALVFGSNLVVIHATNIATLLGISERIISLTIVAIGTSLPELVTTILSSLKKEQDLLLGNIIGSNIFNICVVLGIPVAIFGGISPQSFQTIDIIMLLTSSLLLFIYSFTNRKISCFEGGSLIFLYFLYYFLVFVI